VTRVLLVSNEPVGATMAGPGIRYRQFALQLAGRFDVALVIPNPPEEDLPGIRMLHAAEYGYSRFRKLAAEYDVVVSQRLSIATMQALARRGVRVVYDLYDPLLFEALAFHVGQGDERAAGDSLARAALLKQVAALQTGSAFLCASERQRDLWLGLLSALGRIGYDEYEQDPALDRLVRVVPFGIEPEAPQAAEPVLKGVVPGVGRDDRVLLWGGGIWNWLDPLTPIRSVAALAGRRPELRLFFLGVRHPGPNVPDMDMARRALALAEELGVAGKSVHFNFGWTPYAHRAGFLIESDLGISAQFDSVETRFAFRARLVDYIWADLPIVTTRGDVLADLVAARDLGRVVEPGDVEGWVEAILGLLDDRAEYERTLKNLEGVREELSWPRVAEPLAKLIAAVEPARRPARNVPVMLVSDRLLRAKISLRLRGVRGSSRRLAELAARRIRRPTG
jgi:glycosyltransferase involved in cell wall biosynthesis